MKSKWKKLTGRIAALAAALLTFITMLWGGNISAPVAFAEDTPAYDATNVLDDLEGATVGGQTFDVSDYPFNERGKPQIVAFAEYGYSFYADSQDDYGLYVYLYNPQGQAIDTDTDRNKIELAYAGQENWTKYGLQFLNYSTQAGYEGLFYKFRVSLTEDEKSDILDDVVQNARVYEISGIELSVGNIVTDYTVAMRYTYSGYALGYGSALATESSLACTADGFEKYLNLDVHPTYYRPEGTNGENDYTQDSLHSVYFSVPKDVVAEYGGLSAVHATWLDAVLAPILVTGNKDAYDAILPYLGQDIGQNTDALDYAYVGGEVSFGPTGGNFYDGWRGVYGYNFPDTWMLLGERQIQNEIDRVISVLYWLFYAGEGENSADEYALSSEVIEEKLVELTEQYGGELVNDRYSRVLFDSVAEEFTELNIPAELEYDLRNEVLGSSWWDKLWGITHDESAAFDGIKAIYEVQDSDFVIRDDVLDMEETADNLYIAPEDVEAFKEFYDENKADSVVYLFRYQVSDYISAEADLFQPSSFHEDDWTRIDTNAYFAQETVNLDFDIIDVTFTKDGVSTVIPVVSDPIDNIPGITPPANTTDDDGPEWWRIVLAVLLLLIVLVILAPVLPYIGQAIVWVISLPFRLIGWIVNSIKKTKKKK